MFTANNVIIKTYSVADNCPLLTMYLLSLKSFEHAEAVIKITIYKQVNYSVYIWIIGWIKLILQCCFMQ